MLTSRVAACVAAVSVVSAVPVATALAKKPKAGVYGLGKPSDFQLQVKGSKIILLQTPCADNGSTTSVSKKIKISKTGKFSYKGPISFSGGSATGTIKGKFSGKKVKASIKYDAPGGCLNYTSMTAKFAGQGG